ncbi:MAG: tRNA (N(6)-L-threonylcarbamoyladenosine(37)-C(2))-methylthiotransferase MtaB [Veillonellales bacterium]
MPRVAFATLGCKVNQFESDVIEGLFKARGYETTAFDQPADIYVINTCSVTHLGERKSRQFIRRAARLNPEAVIVVTGCYAQVSPEQVRSIKGVNVIVGTQDRQRIVELAEAAARSRRPVYAVADIMTAAVFEDIPLLDVPGRTRAFLKIQEGCTNYCSYCIIPYARGPLRSRSLASVAGETQKLVEAGFQEIVLTGIHLGAYGRDLSEELTLEDAVKTVLQTPGLTRLRLGSLESVEVSDELIAIMQQNSKLCHHLHLPLQAGEDSILKRMNRHYTTADYRKLLQRIYSRVPDIGISTDIIVGFPGETSAMFDQALEFVRSMNFSRMHVFPYSRRSGTPAAEYPDQVPEAEKKQRVHAMQELADRKAKEFLARFVGRELPVLFEAEKDGNIEGLTGHYIRVYSQGENSLLGTMRQVKLEKLYRDGVQGVLVN